MNFEMFPFDSQACPLLIESFAYAKSELNFEWQRIGNKRKASETSFRIHFLRGREDPHKFASSFLKL